MTLHQLRVSGKPFRCTCGCNVFRPKAETSTGWYVCNGCGTEYASFLDSFERETGTQMPNDFIDRLEQAAQECKAADPDEPWYTPHYDYEKLKVSPEDSVLIALCSPDRMLAIVKALRALERISNDPHDAVRVHEIAREARAELRKVEP